MLVSLRIKNLALVKSAELTFGAGLTVLTGESGSGKSVVLDALALVTGSSRPRIRARTGSASGLAEAEFHPARNSDGSLASPELRAALAAHGLLGACEDPEEPLVLARRMETSGRTRCFIQGQTVGRGTLAAVGSALLELCGQSEAHSLRTPAAQLAALDRFAGLSAQVRELEALVRALRAHQSACDAAQMEAGEAERRRDFLEFQLGELAACDLDNVEEKSHRLAELDAAAGQEESHREILACLKEGEGAIVPQLSWLVARLSAAKDPPAALDSLHTVIEELKNASQQAKSWLTENQRDQEERTQLQEEFGVLQSLASKHRVAPEDLRARHQELEAEMQRSRQLEDALATLENQQIRLRDEAQKFAEKLHLKRMKAAKRLESRLKEELEGVGMPAAEFETHVSRGDLTLTGITHLDLGFSANPGHAPQPLSRVASGGELSRILLCFRLATETSASILTFDEIDAGAGGQTAERIADALKRASRVSQVLCVTHWPQVAGCADHQFAVSKKTTAQNAATSITYVTDEARIEEIGRMLGGASGTARQHATRLVQESTAAA